MIYTLNFFDLQPIKIVDKIWGREIWVVNEEKYCVKFLEIKDGYRCSKHFHNVKHETFVVIKGTVNLECGFESKSLFPGQKQVIPPGTPHRFGTEDYAGAIILEVSTHHDDNDVVRLEESRKI